MSGEKVLSLLMMVCILLALCGVPGVRSGWFNLCSRACSDWYAFSWDGNGLRKCGPGCQLVALDYSKLLKSNENVSR